MFLRLRECSTMIGDSEISSSRWATGLHWTESSCCWSPFLSIVCDSALVICCCCCCTLRHGLRTTLWHFLCTSSLHWMHLNPCRPNPHIRSWQNAQNARYESYRTDLIAIFLRFIHWKQLGYPICNIQNKKDAR